MLLCFGRGGPVRRQNVWRRAETSKVAIAVQGPLRRAVSMRR